MPSTITLESGLKATLTDDLRWISRSPELAGMLNRNFLDTRELNTGPSCPLVRVELANYAARMLNADVEHDNSQERKGSQDESIVY